jgi:hypothetical protein
VLQVIVVAKQKGSSQLTEEHYWPSLQRPARQFYGYGSGQICIIFPDPNPDRDWHSGHADPGPANPDCINYKLINFNMLSKILKIFTYLTLMRKIKHCKVAML